MSILGGGTHLGGGTYIWYGVAWGAWYGGAHAEIPSFAKMISVARSPDFMPLGRCEVQDP